MNGPEAHDEQKEADDIDSDLFREEAIKACMEIGLPEDEAELMIEDMGL